MAGPGIEDHDTDRRGVDQGLQVGPGPLLGPVRAGVGDRRRRLRREQHQDLFVLTGELPSAFLFGEKEVADRHAPMPHRRSLEGLRPHQVRGKAELPDVAGQVAESQRSGKVPEVFEEPRPVGPVGQLLVLGGSEAGADEVLGLPRVVDGRDHAVAGAGQRAGAVDDLLQDGVDVEARADAQDRRAQPGDALPQRLVLSPQFVGTLQWTPLAGPGVKPGSTSPRVGSIEEPDSSPRRAGAPS